jgi:hypothetical protein
MSYSGLMPVCCAALPLLVVPGLVPGIHVFGGQKGSKTWMAGTSPAMTELSIQPDWLAAAQRRLIHAIFCGITFRPMSNADPGILLIASPPFHWVRVRIV